MQTLGKIVVALGLALVLAGLLLWLGGRLGLGTLPGDLHFSGEGWSCFVPITTSILLSVLLTLVLWALFRFFGK